MAIPVLVASGLAFARFGPGAAAPPAARPAAAPQPAPALAGPAGVEARSFAQGEVQRLTENTHQRLRFDREVERIAVGSSEILDVTTLSTRELLLLGKRAGRTSLIVWLTDGGIERVDVLVERDLSLLEAALKDVHPAVRVEIAPDRDAVVLTGLVPLAIYSRRAEAVARAYVDASAEPTTGLLVGPAAEGVAEEQSRPDERTRRTGGGQVINLIRIEGLPQDEQGQAVEDKIAAAIAPLGGEKVTVRRVIRGDVPDDAVDVLVLEGTVPDQVTLVRVLAIAYKSFVGGIRGADSIITDGVAQTTTVFEGENLSIADDIKIVGDESGALYAALGRGGAQAGGANVNRNILQGFGQTGFGGSGRSGVANSGLINQLRANIGRATALELGDGRILSFIEVEDLPQVQVQIRIYEVNRTALLAWQSDLGVITSDFGQGSLEPAAGASRLQGDSAARVGAQSNTDVQNVLGFFSGTLSNQLQVSGSNWAIDSLIGLLEDEEIARGLASTTLSVLSGEYGVFEVGGRVPIDQSFATAAVGSTGVLNSVTFIDFGVKLAVRPLVGERDHITIDFVPEISTPSAILTAALTELTGESPATFAFQSRLLRSSARLVDGQTLLVGGLDQKNRQDQSRQVPWLSKIPLLGLLFQDFAYSDDDLQVVVLIRPSLVRDALPDQELWSFPGTDELVGGALPGLRPKPAADGDAAATPEQPAPSEPGPEPAATAPAGDGEVSQ